jgi:hypothetical protein
LADKALEQVRLLPGQGTDDLPNDYLGVDDLLAHGSRYRNSVVAISHKIGVPNLDE